MSIRPPRQSLPPLNALRAFEAAARLGSFARAAEEIGVTPGAVAQQIRRLEDFVRVPLFRRLPQGVSLTDAAQAAAPRLEAAFHELAEAVGTLRASRGDRALTIAALPCIAQLWLAPRLGALQAAFPGLAVSISAMEEPPAGRQAAHDLALFYLREPPAGASALPEDRLLPVCAPALAGRLAAPADLAGMPLLHDSVWRDHWSRWLRAEGLSRIDAGRGASYSLYALALDAALGGAGVLIGRHSLVARHLARRELVAPFERPLPSGDRLCILKSAGAKPHPNRDAVADWLEASA
jgi:LysR family glycine cleavage system transcriptional activator